MVPELTDEDAQDAGLEEDGLAMAAPDAGAADDSGIFVQPDTLPPGLLPLERSVAVGAAHTCALRRDGTIACWGSNSAAQSTPTAGKFAQVTAGIGFTCGLLVDGNVECWGDKEHWPAPGPDGLFKQISAGPGQVRGVKQDGRLVCWGNLFNSRETVMLPPAGSFISVSSGRAKNCGLRVDGTIA